MEFATCKVCNDEKPYKRLDVHVQKYHNMTLEEYEEYLVKLEQEKLHNLKEPISQLKIVNNIFDGKGSITKEDLPLKEFLKEFNITEKELRSVMMNYLKGKPMAVEQLQKVNENKGIEEANYLKNDKKATTSNLYAAEALEKYHGFRCVEVRAPSSGNPKLWILEKLKENS